MTRSDIPPVKFDKCIFCQSIRQVITLETSQKIIKYKDNNHVLSYRLAGITDLVAAKVKYHLLCYSTFFKSISAGERSSKPFPSALNQTCFGITMDELQAALNMGNVFTVKTVWERYLSLMASDPMESNSQNDTNTLKCFRTQVKNILETR